MASDQRCVDGAFDPGAGRRVQRRRELAIHTMLRGEYISEHDALVARKLAHVIAGGELSGPQLVSEQYVLDLERERSSRCAVSERRRTDRAHAQNRKL